MKQLVQALSINNETTSHVIVGFNDRALAVYNENVVVELLLSGQPLQTKAMTTTSNNDDQAVKGTDHDDDQRHHPQQQQQEIIQAVALTRCDDDDTNKIWYAVARHDKSLALYCHEAESTPTDTSLTPVTVHKTPKRLSSLCFATVPSAPNSNVGPLTVVVAGDLAGDAVAYPLQEIVSPSCNNDTRSSQEETTTITLNGKTDHDSNNSNDNDGEDENEVESSGEKQTGRLLLGHTASMLTGVRVVEDRIFTSDRDEKIRISNFPNTHIICGYLLGHEAFVSCFDVLAKNHQCVSGGGDCTIRLWDYTNYQELATLSTQETAEDSGLSSRLLPVKVVYDQTGTLAVAIYDESPLLDLYRISKSNADNKVTLTRCCRFTCEARLLGLSRLSGNRILVIAQEPLYAQVYQIQWADNSKAKSDPSLQPCDWVPHLKELVSGIPMPASILERDRYGNLKMAKLGETRESSQQWNDASRKDKARERNRRSKKKRKEGRDGKAVPVDAKEQA